MGGTGSSPAGYECTGTYTYRGTAYTEGVPGSADLPVGSTVHGIVAVGDPALFSTPADGGVRARAGRAESCCPRSCWLAALRCVRRGGRPPPPPAGAST